MDIKKSILKIFSVNFLSMISGIIIAFLVPAILSVESYSNLKTFTFYLSYTAFLSLGFVDGMYVKYGGFSENKINKSEFKLEHTIFFIMQVVVTIALIVLAIILKNKVIFLTAMSIIPIAMVGFFNMFYQATGQFDKYSKISFIITVLNLILNVLIVMVFRVKNADIYCSITIIVNTFVMIYLEYNYIKSFRGIKFKYDRAVWKNIKVGFFILIGNLSVILFYGIDRWFIKILFDTNSFAYYSFALSMLSVVNLLVNAVSVTFYNYLSKGQKEELIKKLKNYLIILGVFASAGYFVFAAIVNIFLTKYINSLNIISISFAAYPYMIVINALYVNLYKAKKDEKKYVKIVLMMVVVAAICNLALYLVFKTAEAIAFATTISFIIWYLYSMKDFKYLKFNSKELIYLLIANVSFLIFSHKFSWFMGGISYISITILITTIVYKNELTDIIKSLIKRKKAIIKGV